jgi:type I restriction enzyme M protein
MASKFAKIRQDDLNRFYTRSRIGDLLADQLGNEPPVNALDLGAGEGTLADAVLNRWTDTTIVTVDIDASIKPSLCSRLAGRGRGGHLHHVHDVLDPALPNVLGSTETFDLAVCNPPFHRPPWKRDYARILQDAGLADACLSTADVTAEVIFFAQNLRMLRDGGRIAFIAPDGLVTGARAASFRRAVLRQHGIDAVIQLPAHSFHDTEARCFIVIATKNARDRVDRIRLLRHEADGTLSGPLLITPDDAERRMDYDHHAAMVATGGGEITTLRNLGADVRRGSLSTTERRQARFPTFHTTDYASLENGEASLGASIVPNYPDRVVVAEKGDILIARVDRSLHTKVAIVMEGKAAITDCVYRVRLPQQHRAGAFRALRSEDGVANLLAATKGVSARLLGKADLLDLPIIVDA